MLAPLKKPHWTHRWYTTNVCTSSTGHKSCPFQRQKRYTERCGTAELADLHTTTSTRGLIHTRGHTARTAWQPGGPVPSLLTAPGQEGSRLSGPFQTPSHETETPFPTGKKKKKASLNSPADPPPACLELNKLFLGCPLWGRFSSRRRGAVQSLGGTVSSGAGSVCLTGVAGAVGRGVWLLPGLPRTPSVGARHPAQTDAGWAVHPLGREASRGARDASAQEQPVLARPVPPPPTWTWKCRLTVRMGRAAWSLPWWDTQADLAWGHRREEPINDKTRVTNQQPEFDEGRPSTRIWGVLWRGYCFSHPTASLPHPPPTQSITSALKELSHCSPWMTRFLPLPLSSPTDALNKVGV